MRKIVAVRKNDDGDLTNVQFSDGTAVSIEQAIHMAQNGEIEHVNVFEGRDGHLHIRSNPDGDPTNNLDNLPTF